MQSVDEFTPSTTEPVFGSGLISQTKSQSSTNNDTNGNENTIPSSEAIVNGQNDAKMETNESVTNGTTENMSTNDSSAVHVNGKNETPIITEVPEVEPMVTEAPSHVDSTVPSTKPEPTISTTADIAMESSSAVTSSESIPIVEEPKSPKVSSVGETSSNDIVSDAPVASESETKEVKAKTPRGRAKAPVAAAPATTTPARQSTRGRKPAASSSTNAEEIQSNDDTGAATTTTITTSSQEESSKPTKRQAATIAKDAIAASNQPNSTSGESNADDGNDLEVIPSDGDDDDDITVGKGKKGSPVGRKKRGAPTATASATKKARGKNSITSLDDTDNGVGTSEGEAIQSPPKKARTSAPKKTPEPPSEEYARKLRPRK